MNFGEKFPYALLTFSQKFVEAGYWVHLIPKTCQADCSTHAHLLQKVVKADYWVHYTPSHHVPKKHTANPAPSIPHTPTSQPNTHTPSSTSTPIPHTPYHLYTHHTQSHNPSHTPPLRVDSDEMRQNRKVLALRCWNARKGPRMGPKVHEVDSALARAQTKVDEVYGPYGSSPNPAKFAPSP